MSSSLSYTPREELLERLINKYGETPVVAVALTMQLVDESDFETFASSQVMSSLFTLSGILAAYEGGFDSLVDYVRSVLAINGERRLIRSRPLSADTYSEYREYMRIRGHHDGYVAGKDSACDFLIYRVCITHLNDGRLEAALDGLGVSFVAGELSNV